MTQRQTGGALIKVHPADDVCETTARIVAGGERNKKRQREERTKRRRTGRGPGPRPNCAGHAGEEAVGRGQGTARVEQSRFATLSKSTSCEITLNKLLNLCVASRRVRRRHVPKDHIKTIKMEKRHTSQEKYTDVLRTTYLSKRRKSCA